MHDPMTVAWEMCYPWRKDRKSKFNPDYRAAWLTIWHVDPERDGSDDSCDWFGGRKHRTPAQEKLLEELVNWELSHPYFTAERLYRTQNETTGCLRYIGPGDALALGLTAFSTFAWRLEKRALTPAEIGHVTRVFCNEYDNFQTAFKLYSRADGGDQERQVHSLFHNLLGCYLRMRRPWYRHPRWHMRHWKFQLHPWQTLRRWLFTRCAACGERFPWGGSGVSHQWDSTPPRFMRGERGLHHFDCANRTAGLGLVEAS